MAHPSSDILSLQTPRFGQHPEPEKLYTAPEGLDKLQKLLVKSTEIREVLRNPDYNYLQDLAEEWDCMEFDLANVGALVRLESDPNSDAYYTELGTCFESSCLLRIFRHDPFEVEGSDIHTSNLQDEWKADVDKVPYNAEADSLRAKLHDFRILWRDARQEVIDNAVKMNKKYRALAIGNRLYVERNSTDPGEPPKYGDSRLSKEDAVTIFSKFSGLDIGDGDEQTYEGKSVGKMATVIGERASQGYERDALNSFAQSSTDSGPSTAGSTDARTELDRRTRKALGFRRLDPSLLQSHLLPKLTGDQRSLGQSLGRGSNILLQEAREKLQSGEAKRAKQIGEMASLFRVVQHAIEQDLRSLHSESVGPPAMTQSNDSTAY
jgi:hypothetical protein